MEVSPSVFLLIIPLHPIKHYEFVPKLPDICRNNLSSASQEITLLISLIGICGCQAVKEIVPLIFLFLLEKV